VYQLATQEQQATGPTARMAAYGRIAKVATVIRDTLNTTEHIILTLTPG
jgi:hypothetical protein